MLHYKASDLIKRAMKVANIENSSVISADENRQIINDAFWELYQIQIDEGVTYYLKSFKPVFNNGVAVLPDDFYQLSSVKDSRGNAIPRKNKNSTLTQKCYDIRLRTFIETVEEEEVEVEKSCLISYNDAEIHEIEYYPQCKTLDIDGEGDVELNIPSNAYYQCLVYNLAIYYKSRMSEDTAAMEQLYDNAVATFTDTLQQDINEYPQMRDVYKHHTQVGV